jgi:N-acetylglucosaminyldiphosphoundecaprenol N-acetyl-beta-D-mannosaminyltransferase
LKNRRDAEDAVVTAVYGDSFIQIRISGYAISQNVEKIIPAFRNAVAMKKRIILDLSNTRAIDARVLGLILMLRKALKGSVGDPVFVGLSAELKKIFRLNGMGFLLATEPDDEPLGRIAANPMAATSTH